MAPRFSLGILALLALGCRHESARASAPNPTASAPAPAPTLDPVPRAAVPVSVAPPPEAPYDLAADQRRRIEEGEARARRGEAISVYLFWSKPTYDAYCQKTWHEPCAG